MPPLLADRLPRVRRLWEEGRTDAAIARELGTDRKTVAGYRRRLGLPARWTPAVTIRRSLAGGMLAARDEANRRRREGLATRYGLPADLAPVQVAVVLALAGGPLTAAALADRCGRAARPCHRTPFHRFGNRSVGGKNYLTDLRRRGLVAFVRRHKPKGHGPGRADGLFLLTAAAMDLLTAKEPT